MLNSAKIVSICALFSQIVAFTRTIIIASEFGATSLVDGYNLALVFPGLCAALVIGWLQSGFVGQYVQYRKLDPGQVAAGFRGGMLLVVSIVAAFATYLFISSADQIASILVPENSVSTWEFTSSAITVAAWTIIPMVLAEYLGLVLNCHGKFGAAAIAPVANAAVSVFVLWMWQEPGLDALLWTLILGWVAQLSIVVGACANQGINFPFGSGMVSEGVVSTIKLALPIFPSVLMSNGVGVVIQYYCVRLDEGAVAIYGYASRLHGALTQVLIIGLSTVLLPHLAGLIAEEKRERVVVLFSSLWRATVIVSLCTVAAVYCLGGEGVEFLLGRGEFDRDVVNKVASVWILLSASLLPFAYSTFLAKVFQALRMPAALSYSSLISLVVTWMVSYFGQKHFGLDGIMLSFLFAQSAVLAYFIVIFRKEFDGRNVMKGSVKCVAYGVAIISPGIILDYLLASRLVGIQQELAFLMRGFVFCCLVIVMASQTKVLGWVSRRE